MLRLTACNGYAVFNIFVKKPLFAPPKGERLPLYIVKKIKSQTYVSIYVSILRLAALVSAYSLLAASSLAPILSISLKRLTSPPPFFCFAKSKRKLGQTALTCSLSSCRHPALTRSPRGKLNVFGKRNVKGVLETAFIFFCTTK